MQIMLGIVKNINKIKVIPAKKSIQLAKSFSIPKLAFISKIIPSVIRRGLGNFIPAQKIRINPLIKSIAPNIFINIFFKLSIHLKIYQNASVAQPGLEHFRPKERVVGSNPIGRVII